MQAAPSASFVTQAASGTLTTNQPSVTGVRPASSRSSRASSTIRLLSVGDGGAYAVVAASAATAGPLCLFGTRRRGSVDGLQLVRARQRPDRAVLLGVWGIAGETGSGRRDSENRHRRLHGRRRLDGARRAARS